MKRILYIALESEIERAARVGSYACASLTSEGCAIEELVDIGRVTIVFELRKSIMVKRSA